MEQIITILADFTEVDPEQITADSQLVEDLGLTSLDLLDAVNAFEEAYNLEISDEDIRSLHSVGDIQEYLSSHA